MEAAALSEAGRGWSGSGTGSGTETETVVEDAAAAAAVVVVLLLLLCLLGVIAVVSVDAILRFEGIAASSAVRAGGQASGLSGAHTHDDSPYFGLAWNGNLPIACVLPSGSGDSEQSEETVCW